MSHEALTIPNTAQELLSKIDKSKAEKASPELVNELRQTAFELTSKGRVTASLDRESDFRLVDGSEAIIQRPMLSASDEKFDTEISIISPIKDKHDKTHIVRKKYSLVDDGISSELNPVMNFDERDTNERDLYEDVIDEPYESEEEGQAIWNHWVEGNDMDYDSGIENVSNEEIVNLLRLLKTAERVVPSSK